MIKWFGDQGSRIHVYVEYRTKLNQYHELMRTNQSTQVSSNTGPNFVGESYIYSKFASESLISKVA
jgi:hypothetical protein